MSKGETGAKMFAAAGLAFFGGCLVWVAMLPAGPSDNVSAALTGPSARRGAPPATTAAIPVRTAPVPPPVIRKPVVRVEPTVRLTTGGDIRRGFKNCTELRKVHPGGVPIGFPEYEPRLDRDGDGWACENFGGPSPSVSPTVTPGSGRFKNCTELRKVYPQGVPAGHPAYEPKHDRDKDGWACEVSRSNPTKPPVVTPTTRTPSANPSPSTSTSPSVSPSPDES